MTYFHFFAFYLGLIDDDVGCKRIPSFGKIFRERPDDFLQAGACTWISVDPLPIALLIASLKSPPSYHKGYVYTSHLFAICLNFFYDLVNIKNHFHHPNLLFVDISIDFFF